MTARACRKRRRLPGAPAASSRLIQISGALKNADGSARTGVQGLTFALYRDERDGAPLWMETLNADLDPEGRYTALLGSSKSEGLPIEFFSTVEARWLGIRGQSPWDEEQRVLLISVPYAIKAFDADTLGGLPVSAFMRSDSATRNERPENLTAVGGAFPAPLFVDGGGTTGKIAKFTSPSEVGDSVMTESSGNIGIGTSPSSVLHVAGGRANLSGLSGFSLPLRGYAPLQRPIVSGCFADRHVLWPGGKLG